MTRRLLWMLLLARLTMATSGLVALVILWELPMAEFPWLRTGAVLGAVALLSALLYRQLSLGLATGENTFLGHLLADLALLTYVFHQSAGIENPFLVFYALPLTMAAYSLGWRRLGIVAAAVVAALELLFHDNVDTPPYSESVHWGSGLLALSVITCFAFAVAQLSRRHERAMALAREEALNVRSEQAMGTVAARAADALGSPLATVAVLVNELRRGHLTPAECEAALSTVEHQIGACKDILSKLLSSVGQPRGESGMRRPLGEVLEAAAGECELMDPGLHVQIAGAEPALPQVVSERSLHEALVLLIQHQGRRAPRVVHLGVSAAGPDHVAVRITGADAEPAPAVRGSAPAAAGDDDLIACAASLLARFGAELMRDARTDSLEIVLPIEHPGAARGTTGPPPPGVTPGGSGPSPF